MATIPFCLVVASMENETCLVACDFCFVWWYGSDFSSCPFGWALFLCFFLFLFILYFSVCFLTVCLGVNPSVLVRVGELSLAHRLDHFGSLYPCCFCAICLIFLIFGRFVVSLLDWLALSHCCCPRLACGWLGAPCPYLGLGARADGGEGGAVLPVLDLASFELAVLAGFSYPCNPSSSSSSGGGGGVCEGNFSFLARRAFLGFF